MAAASLNDSFLSFLLVGKTGYGRRSTGNTLLGQRGRFKSERSFTSITKTCQRELARVQGRKVVVVDSPGLADTDMKTYESSEKLATEVATILAQQPDGFDAILIVVMLGVRLTEEDTQICEQLDGLFGKDFTKYFGIVLVTQADSYDPDENDGLPIEEFLRQQGGLFQQLLRKCNNRMVCFNNETKDEDIRKKQLAILFNMVDEMKITSSGYKSETFEKAKKGRDEALLKAKKPFVQPETEDELNLLLQDFDEIPQDSSNAQQFKHILSEVQKIKKVIIEQDKDTGALKDIISKVSLWERAIRSIVTTIEKRRDIRKERKEADQMKTSPKEHLETSWEGKQDIIFSVMGGILLAGIMAATAVFGTSALGGCRSGDSSSSNVQGRQQRGTDGGNMTNTGHKTDL